MFSLIWSVALLISLMMLLCVEISSGIEAVVFLREEIDDVRENDDALRWDRFAWRSRSERKRSEDLGVDCVIVVRVDNKGTVVAVERGSDKRYK